MLFFSIHLNEKPARDPQGLEDTRSGASRAQADLHKPRHPQPCLHQPVQEAGVQPLSPPGNLPGSRLSPILEPYIPEQLWLADGEGGEVQGPGQLQLQTSQDGMFITLRELRGAALQVVLHSVLSGWETDSEQALTVPKDYGNDAKGLGGPGKEGGPQSRRAGGVHGELPGSEKS